MWREPELQELKEENRIKLLRKKEEPSNYLDILSIVEHPAFIKFYDELAGLIGETHEDPKDREGVLGDIIRVGLKENYRDYDLFWPIIVQDKEEILRLIEPSMEQLNSFQWYPLEQLKKMVAKNGETFFSVEMTVKTQFGDYQVTADIFTAKSYNDFLAKLVNVINSSVTKISARKTKNFPVMQVNRAGLVRVIDELTITGGSCFYRKLV